MVGIPTVVLSSGAAMPVAGLGAAAFPPPSTEAFQEAMLAAIAAGIRHFDTAAVYGTEGMLGLAVAEALRQGLIKSREEVFITTKLWPPDAHKDRVVPAIRQSLRNLQLEYVDLFLIHWPISATPGPIKFPTEKENLLPLDTKSVWEAMEECQKLGLTKSIGVSNFSCKKLEQVLVTATIPPAVNQVEMNPMWQQTKLLEFCKGKGIKVTAYSPLGAAGTPREVNQLVECSVLKEIATAKGKSVPQISLRWIYQQGATFVFKSSKPERMKENTDIFDWELSEEELHKIEQIEQNRGTGGEFFISENGPFKSLEELWDEEC